MNIPRQHLGSFQGEVLSRAPKQRRDTTLAQDVGSAVAALAFWAAVAFILMATIVPELPA